MQHESTADGEQRRDGQQHQRQFPAVQKANDEARKEHARELQQTAQLV